MATKEVKLNGFTRPVKLHNGTSCPLAYFKIASIRLNAKAKQAVFQVQAWATQADADAKRSPLNGIPNPTVFVIRGAEYDKWFGTDVLKGAGIEPRGQAYLVAKEKMKDVAIKDVTI